MLWGADFRTTVGAMLPDVRDWRLFQMVFGGKKQECWPSISEDVCAPLVEQVQRGGFLGMTDDFSLQMASQRWRNSTLGDLL